MNTLNQKLLNYKKKMTIRRNFLVALLPAMIFIQPVTVDGNTGRLTGVQNRGSAGSVTLYCPTLIENCGSLRPVDLVDQYGSDRLSGFQRFHSPDPVISGNADTLRIMTSAVCGQCKDRIERNMTFERGIKDVNLDLDTKIVTIRYNPKSTTPDQIRRKISKLGYDADDIPADSVAYKKLPACCKKDAPRH